MAPAPRQDLVAFGIALARMPVGALAAAAGGGFRETANKLEAFAVFAEEGRGGPASAAGWADGVAGALSRSPWERLWAAEGLGYRWGQARSAAGAPCGPPAVEPPAPIRLPFHTGIGLAFATRAVDEAAAGDLGGALERFAERCREHASADLEAAAVEALGLPTRLLQPRLLGAVDGWLARHRPERVGLFWHGVGRGSYFAAGDFLPSGDARGGLSGTLGGAPHEEARRNLAAGYAWALALVNVRHPEIVLRRLDHLRPHLPAGALAHGVAAALAVWQRCGGPAPSADRWPGARPAAGRDAESLFRCGAESATGGP